MKFQRGLFRLSREKSNRNRLTPPSRETSAPRVKISAVGQLCTRPASGGAVGGLWSVLNRTRLLVAPAWAAGRSGPIPPGRQPRPSTSTSSLVLPLPSLDTPNIRSANSIHQPSRKTGNDREKQGEIPIPFLFSWVLPKIAVGERIPNGIAVSLGLPNRPRKPCSVVSALKTPPAVIFTRKTPSASPLLRSRHCAAPKNRHKADLERKHIMNVRSYSGAGQPLADWIFSPPPLAASHPRHPSIPHKADLALRTRHCAQWQLPHKADFALLPLRASPVLTP